MRLCTACVCTCEHACMRSCVCVGGGGSDGDNGGHFVPSGNAECTLMTPQTDVATMNQDANIVLLPLGKRRVTNLLPGFSLRGCSFNNGSKGTHTIVPPSDSVNINSKTKKSNTQWLAHCAAGCAVTDVKTSRRSSFDIFCLAEDLIFTKCDRHL